MISERTKLSLLQYLSMLSTSPLQVLLEKHGCQLIGAHSRILMIRAFYSAARPEQIDSLLDEVIRTQSYFRSEVDEVYALEERWNDLVLCLRLDGYIVNDKWLVPVDPTIEGAAPVEDDLSVELSRSGLAEKDEVLQATQNSGEAFRRVPPDFNGCLTNARVALQTLGTAIAKARRPTHAGSFNETSWGEVLAYLRTSGLITVKEEQGIGGVFGFVSPGAHVPVGVDEGEMARLGRSLVASMCYFLVKRHNCDHG